LFKWAVSTAQAVWHRKGGNVLFLSTFPHYEFQPFLLFVKKDYMVQNINKDYNKTTFINFR
jgi:hypothetical protein